MGHDHHHCSGVPCDICGPDPRDAEIARLKAEVANQRHEIRMLLADTRAELGRAMLTGRAIEHENNRLRAALAAGPAALRIDARDGMPWGPYKQLPVEEAVATVEAAQEAAMKEGK